MSDRGLFGGLFDFNHDGKMDSFEKTAEFATFMHIVNESEKEETDTSGTSINSTYHSEDFQTNSERKWNNRKSSKRGNAVCHSGSNEKC